MSSLLPSDGVVSSSMVRRILPPALEYKSYVRNTMALGGINLIVISVFLRPIDCHPYSLTKKKDCHPYKPCFDKF